MSVNHHIYMKYRAFSLADGTRVKKRSLQQAAINRNSIKDAKIKKNGLRRDSNLSASQVIIG